jgi:hypothetical protein
MTSTVLEQTNKKSDPKALAETKRISALALTAKALRAQRGVVFERAFADLFVALRRKFPQYLSTTASRGVDEDDKKSDCAFGVLQALNSWDSEKGEFDAYLSRTLKNKEIRHGKRHNLRTVPQVRNRHLPKLRDADAKLRSLGGGNPTGDEIIHEAARIDAGRRAALFPERSAEEIRRAQKRDGIFVGLGDPSWVSFIRGNTLTDLSTFEGSSDVVSTAREPEASPEQFRAFAAFTSELLGNETLLDLLVLEGTSEAMRSEGNKAAAAALTEGLVPVSQRGTKPVRQNLQLRLRSPQALFCALDLELASRVDDGPSSPFEF